MSELLVKTRNRITLGGVWFDPPLGNPPSQLLTSLGNFTPEGAVLLHDCISRSLQECPAAPLAETCRSCYQPVWDECHRLPSDDGDVWHHPWCWDRLLARFRIYCHVHARWPRNWEYIVWHSEHLTKFKVSHPEALCFGTLTDSGHIAFEKYLKDAHGISW